MMALMRKLVVYYKQLCCFGITTIVTTKDVVNANVKN